MIIDWNYFNSFLLSFELFSYHRDLLDDLIFFNLLYDLMFFIYKYIAELLTAHFIHDCNFSLIVTWCHDRLDMMMTVLWPMLTCVQWDGDPCSGVSQLLDIVISSVCPRSWCLSQPCRVTLLQCTHTAHHWPLLRQLWLPGVDLDRSS